MFNPDFLSTTLHGIKEPYLLLESAAADRYSYLFRDRVDQLVFDRDTSVQDFFGRIEGYLAQGYWIAGYFSYEFGYFLEPALWPLLDGTQGPYAWLGVWRPPQWVEGQATATAAYTPSCSEVQDCRPGIDFGDYHDKIAKIKNYLIRGYTYQINYTFPINFEYRGDALDLYLGMRDRQPTDFQAFLKTEQDSIISFSPELFFSIRDGVIRTRPMKGTIARGRDDAEDQAQRECLLSSEKTRAENLMIVDLLRNDLGRIGANIRVPQLFTIESYPTLFQMTSTVEADLTPGLGWQSIFEALFPCGSVTGAPKIKSMEIIRELEPASRGVYTGAIGFISPGGEACFNVAIRTAVLTGSMGVLGVGGGIVYDSDSRSEYNEALLKASFWSEKVNFQLIETLAWTRDAGYALLDEHLERLLGSAQGLGFPLDPVASRAQLLQYAETLGLDQARVRLLLDREGRITLTSAPLDPNPIRPLVCIFQTSLSGKEWYLFHKTTLRDYYDRQRQQAQTEGCFEVVFCNARGELTEGSMTNLFVRIGQTLYTPPVTCGLLPGTLRAHLLATGQVQQRVLRQDDLRNAQAIYMGNSVRGLIEVALVPDV